MKTDRKDTTTEMHFQVAFSAIFLKNRKIKSGRFSTKSDKIWVENLQIWRKTGFRRSKLEKRNFSEKFGKNVAMWQVDGTSPPQTNSTTSVRLVRRY